MYVIMWFSHCHVASTADTSSLTYACMYVCTVADPRGGGGQGGPDPPPLSGKYDVLVNYIRICLARYTM